LLLIVLLIGNHNPYISKKAWSAKKKLAFEF